MKRLAGLWVCMGLLAARLCVAEVGFPEKFALAEDRAAVLKELIPGTEEYYYYHCVHYQNEGRLDASDELLGAWIKRHGRTEQAREIQNRQQLLRYGADPDTTLRYLRGELGLHFHHEREVLGRKPDLPTALDPGLISRETLTKRALDRNRYRETVEGFEDTAFDWLNAGQLDETRRRNLLNRLSRPDYTDLPQLIVADLDAEHSGGFGSIPIHHRLFLSQLDELLRIKPDLLNQTNFVQVYLRRLCPNPDVDWRADDDAREAYLTRMEEFVTGLNPSHNSLKAHVVNRRLAHDRALGVYDKARFMAYIKLPRQAVYVNPDYFNKREHRGYEADLATDFSGLTGLPIVGDDEPLVRDYLHHFFVAEESHEAYAEYLNDNYLKEVFAETKIVNGLGDMEKWYSWLPPARYRALKDRIDLDFDPADKRHFDVDELATLDLWVKNVDSLIVKVFEVNTQNFYRQYQREVNTDIDLDGLVANDEEVHTYDAPPLRRLRRHFEFPQIDRRGVYIVEFIGNGKSSRALIRKGRLHYLERTSTAGHVFTVLDESLRKVDNATVWLAGHEYRPEDDGTVTVPFSTQPGRQAMVLTHEGFSSLEHFEHQAENYNLAAGIHVDRESLRRRTTAEVAVRPALYLNGTPVTLTVLEDPALVVTSTDREGISTTKEVRDFELLENRLSTYEFRVPEDIMALTFTLKAKVQLLSKPDKPELTVSKTFHLNQVDTSDKVDVLHLSRAGGRYAVELLDKTGRAKDARPVHLALKHRDFKDEVRQTLQTNAAGKILLGTLDDIVYVTAQGPDGMDRTWVLTEDLHSYPVSLHARAGELIRVPYLGTALEPVRSELSLMERRGGTYFEDRFEALSMEDGFVTAKGLAPGDYELLLKAAGRQILIRVTRGKVVSDHILSDYRHLQVTNPKPLQIIGVEPGPEALTIQLANHSEFSRVHVVATRFLPAYPFFSNMNAVTFPEPLSRTVPRADSVYVSGRNIGDEYRYILDRRYAKKYPGNMLERPGLLISPWAISKTETDQQQAAEGEPPAPAPAPPQTEAPKRVMEISPDVTGVGYATFDFLAGDAAVLLNLEPDANGVVTIAREDLQGRQQVHVVATDPWNTVYKEVTLEEGNVRFNDLRLAKGIDPATHATEQKQITVVEPGDELVLDDVTTSEFEVYDTLGKVYGLYVTLSGNPALVEFGFVTRWPQLPDEEKRELYSKYACHELNFFLYKKDRAFFDTVVRPFIANKRDKTFLDQWLLDADLGAYLEPWAHQQLNAVERILLGERVQGERPVTARHITDLYNLLPPDIDTYNHLFKTALLGRSLDVEAGGVILDALWGMDARAAAGDSGGDRSVNGVVLADVNGDGVAYASTPSFSRPTDSPAKGERKLKAFADVEEAETPKGGLQNVQIGGEIRVRGEYFAKDVARRARSRQLYQALDTTQEYVENNYYHVPIEQQNAGLITVNAFWRDYAQRDPDAPFFSTNLAEASRNLPEMLLALAVLDLPFEAGEHETQLDGLRYSLKAATPMVAFRKQIQDVAAPEEQSPILVSQNFFRHGDRYRHENNEQVDKFVSGEFLSQVVYGCQVAVTNPTSSRQKLDVLLQIPQGALPVANGKYTKTASLDLQPYNTAALEYYFYFPDVGEFAHYPVHVAKDGRLLAFAQPEVMNVVLTPTQVDKTSWDYISQNGTDAEVLEYLGTNNLHRTNLARIAWRMKDQVFFSTVTGLLRERHAFEPTLWSYAVHHNDVPAIREFLQYRDDFLNRCGPYVDTALVTIDPVIRKTYQHMEYSPLVNARTHELGGARKILNDRFAAQHARLMHVLTYRPVLDQDDLMAATYYLLLQDRVEDALRFFERVNPDELATRLQHDYFTAYLAFSTEDTAKAQALVEQYEEYPVDRWRKLFANVRNQLAEIEGAEAVLTDEESHAQRQALLASTEPSFEFKVEAKRISIDYRNIAECRVNYYLMDVELLFSRNPFVQEYSGRFSTVRPNHTEIVPLPAEGNAHAFDLPERFHSSNVVVEVEAGGQKRTQAYYANALSLQIIENYGQVKVSHRDTSRPLAKVYVKVFARMQDGQVRFYKDGYTDLRGRFDYTSLNTNELDFVEKFALLVLSEEDGAVVREAQPPKR
jgi:hypothetical protein